MKNLTAHAQCVFNISVEEVSNRAATEKAFDYFVNQVVLFAKQTYKDHISVRMSINVYNRIRLS